MNPLIDYLAPKLTSLGLTLAAVYYGHGWVVETLTELTQLPELRVGL